MSCTYDIAIIGGGASGMVAAISAKQHNNKLKVVILESGKHLGKKLLSTGNGRCNLSNRFIDSKKYYSKNIYDLENILKNFHPYNVSDFWKKLGLLTTCDSEGRIYPYSQNSSTVLDILKNAIDNLKINVIKEFKVTDIDTSKLLVKISSKDNTVFAQKCIMACGGASFPSTGSDGSGLEIARNLRIKIIPFMPALSKIYSDSKILPILAGLRVNAKVSFLADKKTIKTENGQVQFVKDGLSGICVFNLSLLNNIYRTSEKSVSLNLIPEYSQNQIFKLLLKNRIIFSNRMSCELLQGMFVRKLSQAVMKYNDISKNKYCKYISDSELKKIAFSLQNFDFSIKGNFPIKDAQISSGGVKLSEINTLTMQCKKIKNIYFCGEMLDVNGECGGYNLHWAWLSGLIAGKNAAQ